MNKTVMISLDALSETEFDILKGLKNFSKFIKNGVYSKNSTSVYPTQTYTVHSSIITGTYPQTHGIYNNQYFQPFVESENKEWFWYRHQVKANTLYDTVKANKGSVCSVLWPVTGKAKIKYNIPEILAINNESQKIKVMKNSSVMFAMRCEIKYGKIREGIKQPNLDIFAKNCAVDAIVRHKPDLVMVHLVCVDAAKHNFGVESLEVDMAVKELDKMIGEIMDVCKGEYNIVMFSDHGQFTIHKIVYINVFLQEHGLLSFKSKTYDAYIECMGGSAIVRAENNDAMQSTLKLLKDNKDMLGIEDIYERDMLDKLHMDESIEFVIEAKAGYYLKEGEYNKVIRDLKEEKIACATHGYSPLKENYGCVFFAMGEDIKQGAEIEHMEVVDIAPTTAKIMGLDRFECEGKVLEEIFK